MFLPNNKYVNMIDIPEVNVCVLSKMSSCNCTMTSVSSFTQWDLLRGLQIHINGKSFMNQLTQQG